MALHFTKQQIDEIEQALIARSKKDSQFPGADQLEGTELIPIIQNGTNKVTTYAGLWAQVSRELREYVEQALNTKVDKVEGKELSENDFTDAFKDKLEGVEAGAQVNVQSDWTALSGDAFIKNKPDLTIYATRAAVEDIEALIPIQAAPTNQLADKNFVNSSIATSTAEFKGTYSTLAELETVSANVNDYGYVVTTDSAGNTVYDRYKYNGENWIFEYSLNNSSFTAAEWAAIQSGITAALVQKLETIQAGAQVNVIEGVRVDGTLLPIVNKEVDIQVSGVTGDLRTEDKTDQEFFYRQTADGELNWVPSTACVEKLKGKSIVWNQLVTLFDNTNWSKPSYASASDGILTINGQDLSYPIIRQVFGGAPVPIIGHKYLIKIEEKGTTDNRIAVGIGETNGSATAAVIYINDSQANWTAYSGIAQITATTTWSATIQGRSSSMAVNIQFRNFMVVDLTLMFGAGNEPATVAEFESMFPLPYYDYNPGTLLSFNGHYLKTVGFNLWDEEWELGRYDSQGSKTTSTGHFRCKNLIPVFPSTVYYFKAPTSIWVFAYDKNGDYLELLDNANANGTFTTPANCGFLTFYVLGTSYSNNICINLSSSRNGQYEPYKETLVKTNPTELTSNGVQIFPYGLQSAGNVYDEVTETKAIKRIGRVDLGTLNWSYYSSGATRFAADLVSKNYPDNVAAPLVCSKYIAGSNEAVYNGVAQIATKIGLYVWICDPSAGTDSNAFKTAMSGVYLNYELATPIVYDLDEPLDLKTVVDINGTEQVYPENTSTPYTTPIRADIQYGLKSSQLLTELRIADRLRFERDFTVTDYSGDHSGEAVGFDGSEDATLALPEVINGQVERNTEISRTEEFHYQPVPVKHFNDAYKVDRIYGKTLAWNQFVQNGNFVDGTGWTPDSCTVTFTNNEATITNTGVNGASCKRTNINFVAGHKYYIGCDAKSGDLTSNLIMLYDGTNSVYLSLTSIASSYKRYGFIRTIDASTIGGHIQLFRTLNNTTVGTVVYKNVVIFDLTLMFGAGNEPATVADFESLFPLSYYPYNTGTLISNDAEAIETVGRNVWDEEWENGLYNTSTGEKATSTTAVRCKNRIRVLPSTQYYFHIGGSAGDAWAMFFDADGNIIATPSTGKGSYNNAVQIDNYIFTTPANCHFVVFYISNSYGSTYNHDICINLSDPNFNGQYEPYHKSTLHLGLDSIRVKSHNIWDEEWEEGIYNSSGEKLSYSGYIRSANAIRVEPGTNYYIKKSAAAIVVFYYNNNGTFISSQEGNLTSITTPSTCYAMRFYVAGSTYNNDICVNVSSSFNGQYEAHGDITITGGLKSAGSVYDEIVGSKYVKRVGEVDMGTLTWGGSGDTAFSSGELKTLIKKRSSQTDVPNILSAAGYIPKSQNSDSGVAGSNNFMVSSDGTIVIRSSQSPSGILNYELATPIEYELAEPMMDSGWVDENGTMRVVYEDESAPHVQFKSDITYGVNAGNIIDKANEIIKSFKEKLETLWDAVFNNS